MDFRDVFWILLQTVGQVRVIYMATILENIMHITRQTVQKFCLFCDDLILQKKLSMQCLTSKCVLL